MKPLVACQRLPMLTFAQAREQGVIVLLDGQGIDEQWAGYELLRARF